MGRFVSDIKKYKRYSNRNGLILLLTQQGLWALFVYRINNNIYRSKLPGFLKRIFLFFGLFWQKYIEIVAGISLPYSASIGRSCYIGHFGGIIINANAVIGEDCNISQGVTVGVSGRGADRGVPTIGDRVYIGANAVVAGNIAIGNDAVIAACSLVTQAVAAGTTVAGVPAKKISDNNSSAYIQ
ncbi:serine O-acetyltransferase [Gilvibacter sp.]|uniref:serine O-acetyltransferase n=1 Tax=Gilvibacter sp. TaxID=2729997 RepID=UPI003F4A3235